MCKFLYINNDGAHRALNDCRRTKQVYDVFRENIAKKFSSNEAFEQAFNADRYVSIYNDVHKVKSVKDFTPNTTDFNTTHPLYGKSVAFTGSLEKMDRNTAMQHVVDLGGKLSATVGKKTNILVLADEVKNGRGKSEKQIRAEAFKTAGIDVQIISEQEFYNMIG